MRLQDTNREGLTAGRCKLLRERVFSSVEELLGCLFGDAETQVEEVR